MYINPLTPVFSRDYSAKFNRNKSNGTYNYNITQPAADVVSFSGKFAIKKGIIHKKESKFSDSQPTLFDAAEFLSTKASISQHVENQIEKAKPEYDEIAARYLDTLEAVAIKLKDNGFSFNRKYCEKYPVKTAKSYISKVERSKSFKVADMIRGTLYCNDPYDLSNLKEVLNEISKRGYKIADVEMSVSELVKRGYVPTSAEKNAPETLKQVKDVDIRLKNLNPNELNKLPDELKYSKSNAQKSGYEDIQIHFYDSRGSKVHSDTPVIHELLIIFGDKYAQAKHRESALIYTPLRRFKELNVIKYMDNKVTRSIDVISEIFHRVAKKEYDNAKKIDYLKDESVSQIKFSKNEDMLLEGCLNSLKEGIRKLYNSKISVAKNDNALVSQLKKESDSDRKLVSNIGKNLKDTIDLYTKHSPDEISTILEKRELKSANKKTS